MCGVNSSKGVAHLRRKFAPWNKKHKTALGGRNLEIWTMSKFLHGRPPGSSARSLKPARKKLSLAGVDAEYIHKSRGAASLGLLCRLRGAPGKLCRLSRRAEKRPMHRHLAQTSVAYRAKQPMAVDAGGRSSDTRRGRQLQLVVKGEDLVGGLDNRMEHDDLGGKDGRWRCYELGRSPAHGAAHLTTPLKTNALTLKAARVVLTANGLPTVWRR